MLDFDLALAVSALEGARRSWAESQEAVAGVAVHGWIGATAETATQQVDTARDDGALIGVQLAEAREALQVALLEVALLRAGQGA